MKAVETKKGRQQRKTDGGPDHTHRCHQATKSPSDFEDHSKIIRAPLAGGAV